MIEYLYSISILGMMSLTVASGESTCSAVKKLQELKGTHGSSVGDRRSSSVILGDKRAPLRRMEAIRLSNIYLGNKCLLKNEVNSIYLY